jgi:hypothetical protein
VLPYSFQSDVVANSGHFRRIEAVLICPIRPNLLQLGREIGSDGRHADRQLGLSLALLAAPKHRPAATVVDCAISQGACIHISRAPSSSSSTGVALEWTGLTSGLASVVKKLNNRYLPVAGSALVPRVWPQRIQSLDGWRRHFRRRSRHL